jgi:hypothetical protein
MCHPFDLPIGSTSVGELLAAIDYPDCHIFVTQNSFMQQLVGTVLGYTACVPTIKVLFRKPSHAIRFKLMLP